MEFLNDGGNKERTVTDTKNLSSFAQKSNHRESVTIYLLTLGKYCLGKEEGETFRVILCSTESVLVFWEQGHEDCA